MTSTIKRRPPPHLKALLATHFFTPLFFFCNWIESYIYDIDGLKNNNS